VLLTSTPPDWLNILQELYPAISFQCNWSASCSDPFQDVDWVLFHGSSHWMQEHTPLWSHRPMLGSFTLSDASVGAPTDSNLFVSSIAVGSVVDGVWHFHVPDDCRALPAPSMYERHLSHMLDPATRFPSGCSRLLVSSLPSDNFLPVHLLHRPVKCRSIFSLGGWLIDPSLRLNWGGRSTFCLL
jgi:putative component of membrane protein insertase Oxa1/YidC/SpoIIIJ protein YidD